MLTLNEAINKVLENCDIVEGFENIKFTESLGRVLYEDIIVDEDYPPFNRSAVDGYATKKEFIDKPLKVVGTIAAGNIIEYKIKEGECLKVMTGSYLPEGIDYIAKIEDTEVEGTNYIRIKNIDDKSNIRYKGEDLKANQIVLRRGTLIKPQHIAIMASIGKNSVKVYNSLSVAIFSTGNEIVEPFMTPSPGKIRNSNAYQLLIQCKKIGINAHYLGIIPDIFDYIYDALRKIERQYNVIILTGGVSKGEYDYVYKAINELKYEILFHYILVQPGHPCMVAKSSRSLIFALPGNPVSAYFQFEFLIKPAIFKMMGHNYNPVTIEAKIGCDYKRKNTNKTVLHPVKIKDGLVYPLEYHGSAHLFSLNEAIGVMIIPPNTTTIKKNENVFIRLF